MDSNRIDCCCCFKTKTPNKGCFSGTLSSSIFFKTHPCFMCGQLGHMTSRCWNDERNAHRRPEGWKPIACFLCGDKKLGPARPKAAARLAWPRPAVRGVPHSPRSAGLGGVRGLAQGHSRAPRQVHRHPVMDNIFFMIWYQKIGRC